MAIFRENLQQINNLPNYSERLKTRGSMVLKRTNGHENLRTLTRDFVDT